MVVSAQNQLPSFTSTPTITATAGAAYSYDADATDPEGQTLTYTLPVFPTGMTIAAQTGLISWTPATNQVGARNVTVRATDASGGFAEQSFTINVAPPAAVTQTNASSSGTSVFGSTFTVTVSVTAPVGSGVPTGMVNVQGNAPFAADSCVETLAASGANSASGTCAINPAAPGRRTLVATYSAQPGFAGSVSGTITQVVQGTSQLRIVERPPLPFAIGQSVKIKIELATAPFSPTAPTGSVNVSAPGSAGCVIALPQTECILAISQTGNYTVSASYAGDPVYSAGTAEIQVTTGAAGVRVIPLNGRRVVNTAQAPSYRIWVINTGPAVSGILEVPNATGLAAWTSWTCEASSGATCAASGTAPVAIPVSLPANSSVIVGISAPVSDVNALSISVRALLNSLTAPASLQQAIIAEGTDTDPVGIIGDGFEDVFDE